MAEIKTRDSTRKRLKTFLSTICMCRRLTSLSRCYDVVALLTTKLRDPLPSQMALELVQIVVSRLEQHLKVSSAVSYYSAYCGLISTAKSSRPFLARKSSI